MLNTMLLFLMSLAWASNYVIISAVEATLPPITISAALTDVSVGFPVDYQKHEYSSEYESNGRQRIKKDIFSCSIVKARF
jgi:hypothetical protein